MSDNDELVSLLLKRAEEAPSAETAAAFAQAAGAFAQAAGLRAVTSAIETLANMVIARN